MSKFRSKNHAQPELIKDCIGQIAPVQSLLEIASNVNDLKEILPKTVTALDKLNFDITSVRVYKHHLFVDTPEEYYSRYINIYVAPHDGVYNIMGMTRSVRNLQLDLAGRGLSYSSDLISPKYALMHNGHLRDHTLSISVAFQKRHPRSKGDQFGLDMDDLTNQLSFKQTEIYIHILPDHKLAEYAALHSGAMGEIPTGALDFTKIAGVSSELDSHLKHIKKEYVATEVSAAGGA